MRVGVIGCGTVSEVYLRNLTASPEVDVVACADLIPERAEARAAEFGVGRACTQAELLKDPGIDLVVNLTVPSAHFEITRAALRMGKHVWTEKPLGVDREQGAALLREAEEHGLLLGCAPDTVLGAGLQTSRRLIDDGLIGQPVAGTACLMTRGPERWHPDPAFLYQPGAGPLWDVGIYYVAALVSLLGPVRRVTAFGRRLYPERVIGSGPLVGQTFSVGTDTYVTCILQFASGALVNLIAAFGVWGADLPKLQLYAPGGVVNLPDPNTFGGPITANLYSDDAGWRDVPLAYDHTAACRNCRGIGVVDMVQAAAEGRPPRASGVMAYHVLDVMQAVTESSAGERHVEVASTCERPLPLPDGVVLTRRDA
ncbi:MAG TPA: Gfo/Idh/MocA family oxidoreductase [Candidatus Dormibacteraeota bacterium]